MNKIELINSLISQRRYRRYLEISMHVEQQNFSHVRCDEKIRVACELRGSAGNVYEAFFTHNSQKFDIIFIDGIHTEEQVLKDINNAFKSLAEGGTIILHDCMPPDVWHQREPESFQEGENWNGTVWKAALKVFNQTTHKCSLIDTDWGCGVIDTTRSQSPLRLDLPEQLDYELHYSWLLGYRISIAGFLREQVKVFYHLACMGDWPNVFEEQLWQLQGNGFKDIDLTVLGEKSNLQKVNLILERFKLKTHIVFHASQLTHFERPALLAIEKYAKHNEGYVLYLHSKGVSSPGDETKIKWRRLMMQELVEKWENCVLQLPKYDIIGVNWREMPPVSHFCGNFWYASTTYLRKLVDFNLYYQKPLFQIWDPINHKRLGCEFWIGSGNEKPNLLSLFCKNVDFCNKEYWKDKFKMEKHGNNSIASTHRRHV